MKKLSVLLVMLAFVFSGVAQEEEEKESYEMFELMYIKPDYSHIKELSEAMAKHNKEFHNEGPHKAHVWLVNSGPHTGEWAWAMGPLTFTDLDSRPESKEHTEDWMVNVMPYIKNLSDGEYWKVNSKLSHSPEGTFSGKEIFTVYDIKDFQKYRFIELLEKVVEVYKTKDYDNYFVVYESQFDGNPTREIAVAFGFKNWAFFDEDPKFKKDYEEIHGEGSWFKIMEEYRDIVIGKIDELSEYVPELSGGSEEE